METKTYTITFTKDQAEDLFLAVLTARSQACIHNLETLHEAYKDLMYHLKKHGFSAVMD